MKKLAVYICIAIIIVLGITLFFLLDKFTPKSTIKTMTITSLVFKDNEQIPTKYTCNGDNINPPLSFSDIPQNTQSLAVIVDDPDAPSGTWTHWVVFNMPKTTKEIAENSPPDGIQSMTSFGKPGYGGPCPPSGTHHYHFKIYALDTSLPLNEHATVQNVEDAMASHILAKGELIGVYNQKK